MYDYLVGYARRDVTPTEPAPLCGYGGAENRLHTEVHDPLYGSAVAVTDNRGSSLILLTVDLVNTWKEFLDPIRETISQKTGVPADRIYLNSTHTHSAPDQKCDAIAYVEQYNKLYVDMLIEAGIAAYEDRKEAEMYTAKTQTPKLNCTRIYMRDDGSYVSPGVGVNDPKMGVCHVGKADHEMRLLRFKRKGGKDVLVMNWQAHGTLMSYHTKPTFTWLSADFIGSVRACLEADLDCHFAYFQGAAANMMPTSDMPDEFAHTYADYDAMGRALADAATEALKTEKKMAAGPIKSLRTAYPMKCHHLYDHLLEQVKEIDNKLDEDGDKDAALAAFKALGFNSAREARATGWRSRQPEFHEEEINVFSIGDVGFATAPNEVFAEFGEGVRNGSPFEMTCYLGYTNGRMGYLPTLGTFSTPCYETAITYYEPGTGEKLMAHQIAQLRELKGE